MLFGNDALAALGPVGPAVSSGSRRSRRPKGQAMACKKCGSEMRLWFLRPGLRSFACPSCEFVTIVREDDQQPKSSNTPEDARGWPRGQRCKSNRALSKGYRQCQWKRSAKLCPMAGASPRGARPVSRMAWCGTRNAGIARSSTWARWSGREGGNSRCRGSRAACSVRGVDRAMFGC
jgi:hypothetical protein